MIQIEKNQLEQIEYLLHQSAQGFHLLFDHEVVKKILALPTEQMDFFTFENVQKIQKILGEFIERKTFFDKQRFLEGLDAETYELLVRSYFNIVDNTVFESTKLKH